MLKRFPSLFPFPSGRICRNHILRVSTNVNTKEELTQPIFENGQYVSPFHRFDGASFKSIWNVLVNEKNNSNVPQKAELDKILPILKPDPTQIATPPSSGIRTVWIGHATLLVQIDGLTLLTDPIFSARCSPNQYFGTKRYRDPALAVPDLPHIDAVVISHIHFDHLDRGSVKALHQRFGDNLRWFVPMGLKSWMADVGCWNVHEMTWWNEEKVMKDGLDEYFTFAFTPAHHWCRRVIGGHNKVLWGGWTVIGPKNRFYFAGDTGYCDVFTQIGEMYGPFNLAAIPIGAYQPRWFMKNSHVNPEEAVQIHLDVKAEKSIGIHWGTFNLSYEFYLEPPQKLKDELERRSLPGDSFVTTKIGEIINIL